MIHGHNFEFENDYPLSAISLSACSDIYKDVKLKNQVLLTLLIYQGLTTSELTGLQVQDVDLEEGTVKITPTTQTTGRILPLKLFQVMLFTGTCMKKVRVC